MSAGDTLMKIKGGRRQGEGGTEQLGTEEHLTVVIGQGHMICRISLICPCPYDMISVPS